MIPGFRGGPARPLRAAALALVVGAVPFVLITPALGAGGPASSSGRAAPPTAPAAAAGGSWSRSWAWHAGSGTMPAGCTAFTGSGPTGLRWSRDLVTITTKGVLLAAAASTRGAAAAGSGLACIGRSIRYGRVQVHARLPRGEGLVSRIAFWPRASRGSDWSGVSVPSSASDPVYVTNGCGDRSHGAPIPGRFTGAFHTWTVTWTPDMVSVAVDGRQAHRDIGAYAAERWPGISLGASGGDVRKGAAVLVDAIAVDTYTPARRAPAPGAPPARGTAAGTAATGPTGVPATGASGTGAAGLVTTLDAAPLGTPWLVGGGLAAVGVLLGVLRAAVVARRRPRPAR